MSAWVLVLLWAGCAARQEGVSEPVGLAAGGGVGVYANSDDLTVISPWVRLDQDLGQTLTFGAGYQADVISSATVDVITAATEPYEEVRHEGQGSVAGAWPETRASLSYVGSTEHDTTSHSLLASGDRELLERRLSIGLRYGLTRARVGTVYAPRALWEPRTVNRGDLSATWIVGPRAVVGGGYTLQVLTGQLASPYLRVPIVPSDPALQSRDSAQWVAERHPELRVRHALSLTARTAPLERLYVWGDWQGGLDTWSMRSHTARAGAGFQATDHLLVEVQDRFHWHSAVSFYRSVYTVNRAYITRDRRLGKLWTNTASLSLRATTWRWEALLSCGLEWTRYDDYAVFTDTGMGPLEDIWGVVGQLAVAGEF